MTVFSKKKGLKKKKKRQYQVVERIQNNWDFSGNGKLKNYSGKQFDSFLQN